MTRSCHARKSVTMIKEETLIRREETRNSPPFDWRSSHRRTHTFLWTVDYIPCDDWCWNRSSPWGDLQPLRVDNGGTLRFGFSDSTLCSCLSLLYHSGLCCGGDFQELFSDRQNVSFLECSGWKNFQSERDSLTYFSSAGASLLLSIHGFSYATPGLSLWQ